MRPSTNGALLLATSIMALPLFAMPAVAQDAKNAQPAKEPPSAEGTNSAGVPEIVVTAQRRVEKLLSVPLSIQALSGEDLSKSGVADVTDLQFTSPGFIVSDESGSSQIFIRGVGNSVFVGAAPSVSTYVDDVPRPYAQTVRNMFDIKRVEILKGAQGGLYGRNATGGVVRIITRQPNTEKFEEDLKVSYGEKNTLQVAGYVNLPINDKIAVNIAAERDQHDPYFKNVATNPAPYTAAMFPNGSFLGSPQHTADLLNSGVNPLQRYGNKDIWSVSGKLLLKPTDNLKITIAGDYSIEDDTNGTQLYNATPSRGQAAIKNIFTAFGIDTNFPPGFPQTTTAKFTVSKGLTPLVKNRDYGGSVTAVLSLPGVDITSITAYRKQHSHFIDDLADVGVPWIKDDNSRPRKFFYQELRAVSTNDGPFHFIGGATYFRNTLPLYSTITILPPLLVGKTAFEKTVIHNWSVYAQAGYDLTSALNLTVSGRYIHEKNDSNFFAPTVEGASFSADKFLPSVTLSYKLEGGGNAYARWARGWKGGGVNPVAPPSVFPTPSLGSVFGPETVDTYELGYRAPLMHNRMQLTTAVFYNDYQNLQVVAHSTPAHPEVIFAIVNAGSARTWGAEGSLTWRVVRPLTVGVSAGYLNAKYRHFAIPVNPILSSFDLSGATMLNSPKLQLSLTANLDQPINDKFRLEGNVLVSHLSRIIFSQSGLQGVLPDAAQPGYWLANLRVGVRTSDDRYGVAIYVDNVFNKGYTVAGSSSAGSGNLFNWGNPRIIGGEITAKF